jgi:hypothetical protein
LPENAPATEIKIPDAPTSIILESLSIGHFNISSFYILQYTLIYQYTIGKVDRYQSLLDIAQDHSCRATFAPIGNIQDGYTHTIIHRQVKKTKFQSK